MTGQRVFDALWGEPAKRAQPGVAGKLLRRASWTVKQKEIWRRQSALWRCCRNPNFYGATTQVHDPAGQGNRDCFIRNLWMQ